MDQVYFDLSDDVRWKGSGYIFLNLLLDVLRERWPSLLEEIEIFKLFLVEDYIPQPSSLDLTVLLKAGQPLTLHSMDILNDFRGTNIGLLG